MYDFILPDLGEGVHEGQIVSVRVKEGEPIAAYAPMLEVETDKAAVEIPSPKSGIVSKIHVKQGQTVKVGQVMISIDEGAGAAVAVPATAARPAAPAATRAEAPTPARAEAPVARAPAAAPTTVAARGGESTGRTAAAGAAVVEAPPHREGPAPAAPVVRKLAREMGVDINAVHGSGPNGRILREDVERYGLGHRGGPATAAPGDGNGRTASAGDHPFPSMPTEALPDFSVYGPIRRESAPQIRKTIARQMTRAWLSVPRVTHGDEADITELERNRKRLNESAKPGAVKMTMTAIVMKAVAAALREYPMLNCSYDAASGEIIFKDYIHLGVAVDTPRGLVVPVVRDVDKKSLPTVAKELNDVAEKMRSGKVDVADLRGGTFTVTNVGAIGGTFATPMVNYPEVGILGLGKGVLKPCVYEGQIMPRLIMPVFLSFDHRMVDGADSARFTREVIHSLENPLRLIAM